MAPTTRATTIRSPEEDALHYMLETLAAFDPDSEAHKTLSKFGVRTIGEFLCLDPSDIDSLVYPTDPDDDPPTTLLPGIQRVILKKMRNFHDWYCVENDVDSESLDPDGWIKFCSMNLIRSADPLRRS